MKLVKTIVFFLVFTFISWALYFGALDVLSQGPAITAFIVLILHQIFLIAMDYGCKFIRKTVIQIFLTAIVFWILAIITSGVGMNLRGALGLIVLGGVFAYNYYKWIRGWGLFVNRRGDS